MFTLVYHISAVFHIYIWKKQENTKKVNITNTLLINVDLKFLLLGVFFFFCFFNVFKVHVLDFSFYLFTFEHIYIYIYYKANILFLLYEDYQNMACLHKIKFYRS